MRFVSLMCMVEYAQVQVCSTSTSHCCGNGTIVLIQLNQKGDIFFGVFHPCLLLKKISAIRDTVVHFQVFRYSQWIKEFSDKKVQNLRDKMCICWYIVKRLGLAGWLLRYIRGLTTFMKGWVMEFHDICPSYWADFCRFSDMSYCLLMNITPVYHFHWILLKRSCSLMNLKLIIPDLEYDA